MKKLMLGFAVLSVPFFGNATTTTYQQQIDDLRTGQHNDHMLILGKYSESWGLEDRSNIANLQKTTQVTDQRSINNETQIGVLNGRVVGGEVRLDANEKRLDTVEGNVRETNTQLQVTDQRSIGNSERLDGVEEKNTKQDTHINAVQAAAQTANDRSSALEVRANTVEGNVRETNKQVAVTDARSINNASRLDGVEDKNADQDAAIDKKVDSETFLTDQKRQDAVAATEANTRSTADEALSRQITDESTVRSAANTATQRSIVSESSTRQREVATLNERADQTDTTLVEHDQRITSNTQRIGSVESRMNDSDRKTNQRFSDIDKRMGDNRKLASAGIAGAGAMANIPQVSQDSTFSVGAGAGGYDGQNAVAVGFSARINHNIVTKVSASTNSASEVLWGAGASVEW